MAHIDVDPALSPCGRESLTERKKERTRQAIIAAADGLFHDRGYDATTVDEIAAAADVAPRTFYRYFAGKDDVVVDLAGTRVVDLTGALAGRPPTEPLSASLCASLHSVLDTTGRIPSARSFRLVLGQPELRVRLLERMRRGQPTLAATIAARLGVPATSTQAQLIAASVVTVLITALEDWSNAPDGRTLGDCLDEASGLMFGGMLCNRQ